MALLEITNLQQSFSNHVVVNNLNLTIEPNEVVALVGESGCGKTTLGRTILRLIEPSSGTIKFDGLDITKLNPKDLRLWRPKAQMIFQDPFGSLNPRMKIKDIVTEPCEIQGRLTLMEKEREAERLLEMVELPKETKNRYPHQFSGGQRQRIGIARALAGNPKFIVADEPISSLDLSVQAQILTLLQRLQGEKGLTYLFISHDLRSVEYIADRVAVMYLGQIVEMVPTNKLHEAQHPYTQSLLKAIPSLTPKRREVDQPPL